MNFRDIRSSLLHSQLLEFLVTKVAEVVLPIAVKLDSIHATVDRGFRPFNRPGSYLLRDTTLD